MFHSGYAVLMLIALLVLNTSLSQPSYTSAEKAKYCPHETVPPSCSPGFIPHGNCCVCGDWPNGMVFCDQGSQQAFMHVGYCMTFDNETHKIIAGECVQSYFRNDSYRFYYPLPRNASELNDHVCGPFNSEGTLCGQCKFGFTVPAFMFSKQYTCLKNTDASYGWIMYMVSQLLPITVIFVVVIVFGLTIVSAPANGFIFFSQISDAMININDIQEVFRAQGNSTYSDGTLTKVVSGFYGIWNLNFFPRLIPIFSLGESVNHLHMAALQYVTATYPLFLVALVYIAIELHARDFRPIVWCWKPFHRCFTWLRRRASPKASIVDAFATFILLSYVNFLYATRNLLLPTPLYDEKGNKLDEAAMYYDGSITFLGKEHVPFFIIATIVFATFVALPPLVLFLYPTRAFQNCLNYCKIKGLALHTFVDIFQGCFKDGTNGTQDYRYFAGLYFALRIIIILTTLGGFRYIALLGSTLILIIASMLFAILQPYKKPIYNVIDACMFALFAVIHMFIISHNALILLTAQPSEAMMVLTDILWMLPLLYSVIYFIWFLTRKARFAKRIRNSPILRCLLHSSAKQTATGDIDELLPHRLVSPDEYETLSESDNNEIKDHGTTYEQAPILKQYGSCQ